MLIDGSACSTLLKEPPKDSCSTIHSSPGWRSSDEVKASQGNPPKSQSRRSEEPDGVREPHTTANLRSQVFDERQMVSVEAIAQVEQAR